MCQHVPSQVTLLRARKSARLADVRLLSRMRQHVHNQLAWR
jgi:hypothetical protein